MIRDAEETGKGWRAMSWESKSQSPGAEGKLQDRDQGGSYPLLDELARLSRERVQIKLTFEQQSLEVKDLRRSLAALMARMANVEAESMYRRALSIDRSLTSDGLDYLDRMGRDPKLSEIVDEIRGYGLFDKSFYCSFVDGLPDVFAIIHYVCFGARLSLDPHPIFSTLSYYARYPDVRRAGYNPLQHYIRQGRHSGRQPHPLFDPSYYLGCYPDVAIAGVDPLKHFLESGFREMRNPSPNFWCRGYMQEYADVASRGANPLIHFLQFGQYEGRVAFQVPPVTAISRKFGPLRSSKAALPGPLVSVIVPMYNTKPHWAVECIESILKQEYENIELILVDDASPNDLVREYIRWFSRKSDKVKSVICSRNGGISRATNAGLSVASGQFVAFVDHDDVLKPDAIARCMEVIVKQPACDIIYTDHFLEDEAGRIVETVVKPAWSPIMFLGVMYLAHLVVVRRSCLDSVGELDPDFDGVQDFELELRLSNYASNVERVAVPLYSWRAVPGSIAAGASNKATAAPRQIKAVQKHIDAMGINALVEATAHVEHRVTLSPSSTSERARNVLFIVDDLVGSLRKDGEEVLKCRTTHRDGIVRLSSLKRDSWSTKLNALSEIVAERSAELICFTRADACSGTENWLSRLELHLQLPKVAMVSPMIISKSRVAAAGRGFLRDGALLGLFAGELPDSDGHIGMLCCAREVSLPSPGLGMIRRADLLRFGSLATFGDLISALDFVAMQLARSGLSVVHVPSVRFEVPDLYPDVGGVKGIPARSLYDAAMIDECREQVQRGDPYWPF